MSHPSEMPILSLAKLQALGMDEVEFGCCAAQIRDGRTMVRSGCSNHKECQWANEPVPDRKFKDPKTGIETKVEGGQRPRNVKYLEVKPSSNGRRRVNEGYCSCFEWHQIFAKRHRQNGVICRVTGGEGASYSARGSVKVAATEPGAEPVWVPKFWEATVPPFQPSQLVDVQAEEYAESVIRKYAAQEEEQELRAALGAATLGKVIDGAKDVTLEFDDDEVARVAAKRGPKDH